MWDQQHRNIHCFVEILFVMLILFLKHAVSCSGDNKLKYTLNLMETPFLCSIPSGLTVASFALFLFFWSK